MEIRDMINEAEYDGDGPSMRAKGRKGQLKSNMYGYDDDD